MSATDKKKARPKGKKASPKRPAEKKVAKTKKVAKKAPEEKKPKKASAPAKKVAEKKEPPAKVAITAAPLELGPAPEATVASRHIDSMHERPGRGFSFGELSSAGVPVNVAKREGLSLDVRRRSVLAGNVEALKGWFKSEGPVRRNGEEPVVVAAVSKKK